jgi:hypothetical protein
MIRDYEAVRIPCISERAGGVSPTEYLHSRPSAAVQNSKRFLLQKYRFVKWFVDAKPSREGRHSVCIRC